MIKAVLFDYGGVLTEAGKEGSTKKIFVNYFGDEYRTININDLSTRYAKSLISTEQFFAEINNLFTAEKNITVEDFLEGSKALLNSSKVVYDFAKYLRRKDIKTGVVSNVYPVTANMLRKNGKYEGFDPVILSCDIKAHKPEVEFYQKAVSETGAKPEEIIFVDDKEKCLTPAERLGMKTVLAMSPEQIVEDVSKIIEQENKILL